MSYERAAEIASRVTYSTAGGTFVAGISLNEWAAIVGMIATIGAFCLTWYYKAQHLKLAQRRASFPIEDGE